MIFNHLHHFLCILLLLATSDLNAKWGRTEADNWVIDISKDPMDDSINFYAKCREKYKDNVYLEIRYTEKKGVRFIIYTDKYVGRADYKDKKTMAIRVRYDENNITRIKAIPEGYKMIIKNPQNLINNLLGVENLVTKIDYSMWNEETEDREISYQFEIKGMQNVELLLSKILNYDKRN